jgi:hypothetical protein
VPAAYVIGPKGERLTFAEAPQVYEDAGLMPHYAVQALLGEGERQPSFNVRPSDVNPKMTCRRQRVWMTNHDYGVDPRALEAMEEGTALHDRYGTQEIEVPIKHPIDTYGGHALIINKHPERLPVCGVPMRGRIDFLFPERIEDIKTSTPFWIPRFPSKEAKLADPTLRPYADIYVNASFEEDDIKNWKLQLSIYRVLLEKEGKPAPTKGRVWRRLAGVKADTPGRWKRFDFDLLDEAGLEAEVGPWVRELQVALTAAEAGGTDAWQLASADGKEMTSSRKGLWKCNSCPAKDACFRHDGMDVF